MTQLLLVRHAHNDWIDDRLAGWVPGVHLNAQGRAAAAALADRLAGYPLQDVYASPLERARETAEYLAQGRNLTVRILPEIGEVHAGAWTGRPLAELVNDPLWPMLHAYPSGTCLPEGESMAEVQCRACGALERICADHPSGAVAIVSHGDVIKSLVAHYAGLHLDLFQRLAVDPASLSVIRITAHGPRLLLLNDTGHIPQAPETDGASAAADRDA